MHGLFKQVFIIGSLFPGIFIQACLQVPPLLPYPFSLPCSLYTHPRTYSQLYRHMRAGEYHQTASCQSRKYRPATSSALSQTSTRCLRVAKGRKARGRVAQNVSWLMLISRLAGAQDGNWSLVYDVRWLPCHHFIRDRWPLHCARFGVDGCHRPSTTHI